MSVHKSKRGLSKMEFVNLAGKIFMSTWKITNKLPPEFIDIKHEIRRCVISFESLVSSANDIKIDHPVSYVFRKKYLLTAYTNLIAVNKLLDHLYEMLNETWDPNVEPGYNPIYSPDRLEELQEMMNREFALILGVLSSDLERYKVIRAENGW